MLTAEEYTKNWYKFWNLSCTLNRLCWSFSKKNPSKKPNFETKKLPSTSTVPTFFDTHLQLKITFPIHHTQLDDFIMIHFGQIFSWISTLSYLLRSLSSIIRNECLLQVYVLYSMNQSPSASTPFIETKFS